MPKSRKRRQEILLKQCDGYKKEKKEITTDRQENESM